MKRRFLVFITIFITVIFSGCGSQNGENSQKNKTEYQDIMVERKYFPSFEDDFQKDGEKHTLKYLGIQFLGEEPIQIWAEIYENEDKSGNIYQWGLNGEKKLLAEEISDHFIIGGYTWYLDREGCFYLIDTGTETNSLSKLDSQGNEIFNVDGKDFDNWYFRKVCQTPDDKIYLEIYDYIALKSCLAELDPDNGNVSIQNKIELDPGYSNGGGTLGAGIKGLAVYRLLDIREVNTEKGEMKEVLTFNGTSYSPVGSGSYEYNENVKDLRVIKEGRAEVLKSNDYGNPAYVECLSLETVRRTPVKLCALTTGIWLKRQVMRFNQENENYHIILEEIGISDGTREEEYAAELEDFARRVSVELATGGGPDILVGEEIIGNNVMDMIEKGVLEDLRPYMERTGIREEDYFPTAFNAWRRGEEIYGICGESLPSVQEGDRNIIGTDIRKTVENLLAYQEKAVYMKGVDSQKLLRRFLEGSETLFGMIDWEAGTCNFKGDFFRNLLEMAGRYGDVPGKQYPCITQKTYYDNFYVTPSLSELEKRGLALAGWMFDDGVHAVETYVDILAINAGSAQKEGAWEFLCFLLEDESQKDVYGIPVRRETFQGWIDKEFERSSGLHRVFVSEENRITGEWEDIGFYEEADREFLEKEKLPYFEKMLEEARHLPIRPVPVLNIICEEAEHYFNGNKSIEEVVEVITNRVELYLNERK